MQCLLPSTNVTPPPNPPKKTYMGINSQMNQITIHVSRLVAEQKSINSIKLIAFSNNHVTFNKLNYLIVTGS